LDPDLGDLRVVVADKAQQLEPRLVVSGGDVGDAHHRFVRVVRVVVEAVRADPAEVPVALPAVDERVGLPSLESALAPPLLGPVHRQVVAVGHRRYHRLHGRVVVLVERPEAPGVVARGRDQVVDEPELIGGAR